MGVWALIRQESGVSGLVQAAQLVSRDPEASVLTLQEERWLFPFVRGFRAQL